MGDEKEREEVVFVYMVFYQLRGLYTFLVCGAGDFFSVSLKRKNTRASSFYHFILDVVIMHLCLVQLRLFM